MILSINLKEPKKLFTCLVPIILSTMTMNVTLHGDITWVLRGIDK
jgi:hypothetical protein